jgi:hypothetical protein
MDIEGAEVDIFNNLDGDWLNRVRSLNVEFHNIDESQLLQYVCLLKDQGFIAYKSVTHWSSILAYRK